MTELEFAELISKRGMKAKVQNRPYSKLRSARVEVDGIKFQSKKEAARYGDLKLLEKLGQISGLALQVRLPIIVNEIKISEYRADFCYSDTEGKLVVEDCKGYQDTRSPITRLYKLKKKLVEAQYGIQIIET